MQVTSSSRTRLRLQNLVFVVLFIALIGLLGWLSTRYHFEQDWTADGRNSLSDASLKVLDRLPEPIQFTLYATDARALREPVDELVRRYQRVHEDINLTVVNPQKDPRLARELGITTDGELLISYQGRSERLINEQVTERGVTNALQQLARTGERYLVFLVGHGERSPQGQANHDLEGWGRQLEAQGFKLQQLNLVTTPTIPDNSAVLVIASPQVSLLPGEVKLILDYLQGGGNLLWLHDPGEQYGLERVAEYLGIEFLGGTVVDMAAVQLFGNDAALYALGTEYGPHPIARDLDMLTLYPETEALQVDAPEGWDADPFLQSTIDSWLETSKFDDEVGFDQGSDLRGPLTIGVALSRRLASDGNPADDDGGVPPARSQRIVVIGDGDFLSNAFAGNGGNLEMGHNIINWLSHDDLLIDIPVRTAGDVRLQLSERGFAIMGLVFLIVLPLLLLGAGSVIWWHRRRA